MALGAHGRVDRWVTELGDGPLGRRVALSAVCAEHFLMPVFGGVAAYAAEVRFADRELRMRGGQFRCTGNVSLRPFAAAWCIARFGGLKGWT